MLEQWVAPRVALLAFAGVLLAGLAASARSLLDGERPAPEHRRAPTTAGPILKLDA
jgi:hypothetical protein